MATAGKTRTNVKLMMGQATQTMSPFKARLLALQLIKMAAECDLNGHEGAGPVSLTKYAAQRAMEGMVDVALAWSAAHPLVDETDFSDELCDKIENELEGVLR